MENNSSEQFDSLLEKALSSYSSSAPRPGLETRILARAHAETYPFRTAFFRPLLACALLACVLCAAAISVRRNKSVPPKEAATRTIASSKVASPAVPVYPVAIVRKQIHRSSIRKMKQKQFPASAPLTAQERALLAFVSAAPEETKQAFAIWQNSKAEPIRIEPIQIALLNQEN